MLNKVRITGVNTNDLKVLTNDEMKRLFIEMKNGDLTAREQLANGNLKLVLSILKKFQNKDNIDDLFQIGCVGLMKAIDNFDITFDVKFSTYAVPMILGEIKRYLRDNNSLRISRSIKDLAYKILKVQEEYLKVNGEMPNIEYIAKCLDVNNYDVSLAIDSLKEPLSIFSSIYNDGGDTIYLYDQIEDKKSKDKNIEIKLAVNEAMKKLKEREKFILDERFIVGKTQSEIANELMISQAQVSRLEKNAIKELKKVLKY